MSNKDYESLGKTLLDNNISAKKKFGQNFLHDKNIIKRIVKAVSYTHLTLPTKA